MVRPSTVFQTLKNWPKIDQPSVLPPTLRRGVGRPPRNRRREEGEQEKGKRSTTIKCTICHEFGHNKLTCKGGLTEKEKKILVAANNKGEHPLLELIRGVVGMLPLLALRGTRSQNLYHNLHMKFSIHNHQLHSHKLHNHLEDHLD
ncbi:hypothetical protein BVRB_3g067220 [Beta vulgaris subsp. vulgaris]|nr:hypothetical protein BVRB_3g067220 [Beta vulgaris subsp. vulgaris]